MALRRAATTSKSVKTVVSCSAARSDDAAPGPVKRCVHPVRRPARRLIDLDAVNIPCAFSSNGILYYFFLDLVVCHKQLVDLHYIQLYQRLFLFDCLI